MEVLYTLGIDIGTTTTQVIVCELTLAYTIANYLSEAPQIVSREIIYKSPVVITPMLDAYHLDEEKLIKIILGFIGNSDVPIELIKTGAVIITGESSLKENAKRLIDLVADLTGEFVVTTAGPDLESLLAGAGSGAQAYSKEEDTSVTNIDIGGGTTNCIKFINGEAEDTLTLHLGGRLIKFDQNYKITYVSPVLKQIDYIEHMGVEEGEILTDEMLYDLTYKMAEELVQAIGEHPEQVTSNLYVSKPQKNIVSNVYMISGGVGEYVYGEAPISLKEECKRYMDIGPTLAMQIKNVFRKYNIPFIEPKQKLRATVCGVGAYSMQLSGNTIYAEEEVLPLKNMPLIKVTYTGNNEQMIQNVKRQKVFYDEDCAIYMKYEADTAYQVIKHLSECIINEIQPIMHKIVLVIDKNIGKAIGQTIACHPKKEKPLICIDHIHTPEGNYIDIGSSIGDTVPVVIKTLIF